MRYLQKESRGNAMFSNLGIDGLKVVGLIFLQLILLYRSNSATSFKTWVGIGHFHEKKKPKKKPLGCVINRKSKTCLRR